MSFFLVTKHAKTWFTENKSEPKDVHKEASQMSVQSFLYLQV